MVSMEYATGETSGYSYCGDSDMVTVDEATRDGPEVAETATIHTAATAGTHLRKRREDGKGYGRRRLRQWHESWRHSRQQ